MAEIQGFPRTPSPVLSVPAFLTFLYLITGACREPLVSVFFPNFRLDPFRPWLPPAGLSSCDCAGGAWKVPVGGVKNEKEVWRCAESSQKQNYNSLPLMSWEACLIKLLSSLYRVSPAQQKGLALLPVWRLSREPWLCAWQGRVLSLRAFDPRPAGPVLQGLLFSWYVSARMQQGCRFPLHVIF